jgi:hypothetical protein
MGGIPSITDVPSPEVMTDLIGITLRPLFWLFSGIAGNQLEITVPLTRAGY